MDLGTTFKHVVVIPDGHEDDSGISESASEESSLMTETPKGGDKEAKEGWASVVLQIFVPYLIAGVGMMLAGMLLDHVQVKAKRMRLLLILCLSA